LRWHFFATSHGKGCVDAVGGTIKRAVWTAVLSRQLSFTVDSAVLFQKAAEQCTSIRTTFLSTDEISAMLLQDEVAKRYEGLECVKKTLQKHCIQPLSLYVLETKEFTNQEQSELSVLKADQLEIEVNDLDVLDSEEVLTRTVIAQVGEHYVVRYVSDRQQEHTFVGRIDAINDDNATVLVQFFRRAKTLGGRSVNAVTEKDGDVDFSVPMASLVRQLQVSGTGTGRRITFSEELHDVTE
jgi:hypothetical protein